MFSKRSQSENHHALHAHDRIDYSTLLVSAVFTAIVKPVHPRFHRVWAVTEPSPSSAVLAGLVYAVSTGYAAVCGFVVAERTHLQRVHGRWCCC
jgi:hypothetical protein